MEPYLGWGKGMTRAGLSPSDGVLRFRMCL